MENIKYDAFISYRHGGIDQSIAEQIHKRLETFKLPSNILSEKKKKGEKTRIERVFRDQEELPLSDNLEESIIKALENSDSLIVICSPRFQESLWCKKEVETFIKLHGRKHVYAVLVEGEPDVSFPKELVFNEKGEPVEPLAADLRASNKKELKKRMDVEMLRLLAPMFGLGFDDLRQRHRERKARAAFRLAVLVAAISIAFGGVCGFSAVYMAKQNDVILDQNIEISQQNDEIIAQNAVIEANNEKLIYNQALSLAKQSESYLYAGDRFSAIETAYQALTEYDGYEMPYTEEAQRALSSALLCYDSGYYYSPKYLMNTYGTILDTKVSPDRKYMMAVDSSHSLFVYEVDSLTKVYEANGVYLDLNSEHMTVFIDETSIGYFNEDGRFVIADVINGINYVSDKDYGRVGFCYSSQRKYIALSDLTNLTFYDATNMEEILSITKGDIALDDYALDDVYFDYESDMCVVIFNNFFDSQCVFQFYDLASGELLYEESAPYSNAKGCVFDSDNIYMRFSAYHNAATEEYLFALDKNTFEEKWINKVYTAGDTQMYVNCDVLVAVDQDSAYVIDKNTGESLNIQIFDEKCVCTKSNQDFVLFYFSNGLFTYYDCKNQEQAAYMMMYVRDDSIENLKACANGFIGYKGNSLGVTYYSKLEPPAFTPVDYTNDAKYGQTDSLVDSEASQKAEEMGLENYFIVERITYSEKYNYALIDYSDNSMDVYDLKKETVTDHLENVTGVLYYSGVDVNGNEYYGLGNGGFALNKSGKVISVIPEYADLSDDGESVIIIGSFGDYSFAEYPIYSTDELIRMAETILASYSH